MPSAKAKHKSSGPLPPNQRLRPWLIICLVLLSLATGCRREPSGTVEISWATNQHFTRFEAVAGFERNNPGIKVKIRPVSEPRQFLLQCLFGQPPDVITFFQVDSFQSFAGNGMLLPLPAGEYQPWPFYQGLRDYCFRRGDNALMALPQVAYPYLLYFNPDLVPPAEAKAVKDWDGLLRLIKSRMPLPDRNGKRVFGLDIQSDMVWFNTWYWQRNGRFFDPEDGRLIFDEALAADSLSAMGAWRKIKGLLPRPADRLNLPSKGSSQGVLGSLFLQGRAMFYWSGSWKICDFANQDKVRWGITLLPAGPCNGLTILGGNSFGVSARSSHPVEAKRFVRYLAGLGAQKSHTSHRIYMPSRKACPVPTRFEILREQIGLARTMEYSPGCNEALLKEIMKQSLEAHRLGLMSAARAAAMMRRSLVTGQVGVAP